MLDWEEEEDGTSSHGSANILNKAVIVSVDLGVTCGSEHGRLDTVPVSFTSDSSDTSLSKSEVVDVNEIFQSGSSRWLLDECLVDPDKENWQHEVDYTRDEIGSPEADESGEVGGRNTNEGTDVDEQVEPQHDRLRGRFGINDSL